MIRFTKVLATAAALLAAPSIASAVSLDIVGASAPENTLLGPGDTVTFDLRIDWTGLATDVYGVSADVTGYDLPDTNFDRQFGLAFAGGVSTGEVLNTNTTIPAYGTFSNGDGLDNATGGPVEQYVINQLNPQAFTTNLFGGVSFTPAAGDGSGDFGIGGGLVSGGDIHFQVTFANVLPASYAGPALSTTLNFDLLLLDLNGDPIAATGDTFALSTIPEPGTALLMGLGLAGLATTRRR